MSKLKLPEVGQFVRQYGKLLEIQDVTPPPTEKLIDYIFEIREATIQGHLDNQVVKVFGTMHGIYGETTAVKNAIDESLRLAVKWPSIEMVVVQHTSWRRMRPAITGRENFYDKRQVAFDALASGACAGLQTDKYEEVWSSKRGWLIPEPIVDEPTLQENASHQ